MYNLFITTISVKVKPPILALVQKQQRNTKADATNTHPVHPTDIRHWKHECDVEQENYSITQHKSHTNRCPFTHRKNALHDQLKHKWYGAIEQKPT